MSTFSPSALRALRSTLSQFTTSITSKSAARTARIFPIQTIRCASILADLRDVPSAQVNKKRLGRGASSGKGKQAGRGKKGQGQRSGLPRTSTGVKFEGGQTPYIITHGTHGFVNTMSKKYSPINLEKIQSWIDQGRIDPTKDITFKELMESRCLHGIKDGVKLLARGKEHLKVPINIIVSKASKEAIARIEELGGTITTRFFNKTGIKAVVHPELFPYGHRLANATSREELEYYRDPAHRGYLSHTLAPGESPSLFWKAPKIVGDKVVPKKKNAALAKQKREDAANKLF